MVLTDHDRMYGADAKRQEDELGRNPPSWVANEDIWTKAKKAAADSPADEKYAVITHIYKKMGGKIK